MKNPLDYVFVRKPHVCPWWCCFTFDNPLRRLLHDPAKILSPYVRRGSLVVDIGPGMGYFTVPLCSLVGDEGRVVAVDLQQKMLDAIVRRAQQKGVSHRLVTHLATEGGLGITERADFVLAFWMVHEVPDEQRFFKEVKALLKPEGQFLLCEPLLHVSEKGFSKTLENAVGEGLKKENSPSIAFSRSAVFTTLDRRMDAPTLSK